MTRTRIEMKIAGYNAYRNDPSVVAALEEVGETIRARGQANVDAAFLTPFNSPGPDITVETVHNPTRAVVFVTTSTLKARIAEHTHRALNRAVQG